ncbi:MAG: plasmid stabilization protein [Enterovirga sp.]|jgi:predicted nucleic acid-binding protein|nr:plasmid stabilization protein [Enterovirga sp.]
MIVLDTNVISELMKTTPAAPVLSWIIKAGPEGLYTTAVTHAEIMMGVAIMPDGERRREITSAASEVLIRTFDGYTLPFDTPAASHYGDIIAVSRRQGRTIGAFDAMILGIARVHGASVATRNVKHFADFGVPVRNPWNDIT